jgi:ASC-1-like (ASCH) protein
MRSNLSSSSVSYSFKIIDSHCREFPVVVRVFNERIAPIYGDQSTALQKIGDGQDRLCEGLFENQLPKGIVVYKKKLVEGALELKTLCLVNPGAEGGKGLGSMLVDHTVETAERRRANRVFVTVSTQSGALGFFQRNGFSMVSSEPDRYSPGQTEYTLIRPVGIIAPSLSLSVTASSSGSRLITSGSASSSTVPAVPPRTEARPEPGHDRALPVIRCSLGARYVSAIARGEKNWEGRCNTSFFRDYQVGRTVIWYAGREEVKTEIIDRQTFRSFNDMIDRLGHTGFVPEARNAQEAKAIYHHIPGYTEKSQRSGVLALKLRLFSPANSHQDARVDSSTKRSRDDRYERDNQDAQAEKRARY